MIQRIGHVTVLVRDQDEALRFYVGQLGIEKRADVPFGPGRRWVTVAPPGSGDVAITLVKADTQEKLQQVGRQVANHVLFVFETNDCQGDYERLRAGGVKFYGEPKEQPWGTEVVFEDLYGNRHDLLEPKRG